MPKATLIQNGKMLQHVDFEAPCLLASLTTLIAKPCGGKGYCGKCCVQVRGAVSRMTSSEHDKLTKAERAQGYRLACQAMATGDVTVTVPDKAVIEKTSSVPISAVKPMGKQYGFALDLGTTTIYASLYHLPSGKLCGQKSVVNPQIFDGADVLSRIDAALHGDGKRLSTAVQYALYDLCAAILSENRIAPNDVDAAVLVGNTAMLYLLFDKSPVSISASPFQSETLFGAFYPADFLPVQKGTDLYVAPCISAFLGADTTAAILGSCCSHNKSFLLADLGTNAEMILHTEGKYYGCSCAAGPAFEGVGLACGMPAVEGAVQTVRLSGGFYSYETIGNTAPKGFCGSGVLDFLSCLLRSGALQNDGKLVGCDRVYLSDTPLYVSQQDIRAVQLAKAAVRTGMEVLLSTAKVPIDQLSLAGTFGSSLHLPSAVRLGLIPPSLSGKTTVCGNAAGTGCAMLLLNRDLVHHAEEIARATQTVQLADLPQFQEMLCRFTALE